VAKRSRICSRSTHRLFGERLRGVHVLLHAQIGDRRDAVAVEGADLLVGRETLRDVGVDAEQVADRVGVLRAREPTQRARADLVHAPVRHTVGARAVVVAAVPVGSVASVVVGELRAPARFQLTDPLVAPPKCHRDHDDAFHTHPQVRVWGVLSRQNIERSA
jgi:hypothetical protein